MNQYLERSVGIRVRDGNISLLNLSLTTCYMMQKLRFLGHMDGMTGGRNLMWGYIEPFSCNTMVFKKKKYYVTINLFEGDLP